MEKNPRSVLHVVDLRCARSYIYVVVDLIDLKVLNVKRFSLLSEYPFVEVPQT